MWGITWVISMARLTVEPSVPELGSQACMWGIVSDSAMAPQMALHSAPGWDCQEYRSAMVSEFWKAASMDVYLARVSVYPEGTLVPG
jgi:hypothetical protein